jgi:hypothetical protein
MLCYISNYPCYVILANTHVMLYKPKPMSRSISKRYAILWTCLSSCVCLHVCLYARMYACLYARMYVSFKAHVNLFYFVLKRSKTNISAVLSYSNVQVYTMRVCMRVFCMCVCTCMSLYHLSDDARLTAIYAHIHMHMYMYE